LKAVASTAIPQSKSKPEDHSKIHAQETTEVKQFFLNSTAVKHTTVQSISSGLQKQTIASSPGPSKESPVIANYSILPTVVSVINNSSQEKKPDQGKCVHGRLRKDCDARMKTILHKICNHKVVVRCCDKGQEDLLWCGKYTKAHCISCGWKGPKKIKCRSVLQGIHSCLMCKSRLQFKPKEVNLNCNK